MAVVATGAKRRPRAAKPAKPVEPVCEAPAPASAVSIAAAAADPLRPIARDAIAHAAAGLGGARRLIDWVNADAANERTFWGTIFPKLLTYQESDAGAGGEAIDEIRWTIIDPAGGADGGA